MATIATSVVSYVRHDFAIKSNKCLIACLAIVLEHRIRFFNWMIQKFDWLNSFIAPMHNCCKIFVPNPGIVLFEAFCAIYRRRKIGKAKLS